MAAFMALEDLCDKHSLSPSQTEAVFKAANTQRNTPQDFDRKGKGRLKIRQRRFWSYSVPLPPM